MPADPSDDNEKQHPSSPDSTASQRDAETKNTASNDSSPEVQSTVPDPITPNISLTPRQKRVFEYLARRRSRSIKISPRHTPHQTGEDTETQLGVEPLSVVPLDELEVKEISDTGDEDHDLHAITQRLPRVRPTPTTPVSALSDASKTEQSAPAQKTNEVVPDPETPVPESLHVSDLTEDTQKLPRLRSTPQKRSPAALITGALAPFTPQGQTKVKDYYRAHHLRNYYTRKRMRRTRDEERRIRNRFWISITSTLLSLLVVFLSLATAIGFYGYQFYTHTQAKYERQVLTLADLMPLDNLKIFDSKGVLLTELSDQGIHTTVPLSQIAPVLQQATIATEDKDFWTNKGVDLLRIIRAALDNLRSGHVVEGGSTITQQLIKNLIVGNETTAIRKLEEIILTPQVNSHYSKQQILEMYLNSIYYGHQAYGIDAAATTYFGLQDTPTQRASSQLDLAQAAMLAGIPSNPTAYDPLNNPQLALTRCETVLDGMVSQRYITKVDELDALKEARSPDFLKHAASSPNRAPHFTNFVLRELEQMFHLRRDQLSRSGMIVHTTLDITLQDKIQKIAQEHIAELRDDHHLSNAAEVLIDFHTGAIISLLGSIDYNDNAIDGQFDVATQGYRQPGSSFKPYVYVTAFEQGSSPAQAINDAPTTIQLPPGSDPPTFTPHNYDLGYHGHMTLRCALQNSLNIPAVRVLQHVGIPAAMKTAQDMGISSYEGTPGYSLVLGGLGVRLLDHTSAIGTFANGGVHVPYYAVSQIVSGNTGKVIYQHQQDPGKRVISPQLAYMMTSVLSDNASRIPEFFDCNVLQLYSNSQEDCYAGDRGAVRPAAAKTGTTNDFRDNWTVGYTTDYVMGVWAGNDDNTPMIDVTGVQGAAPIWHDSMLLAEQGKPIRDFVNPGGLDRATVTYPDGVQTTDWFLPGTEPQFTLPNNPDETPTVTIDQGNDPQPPSQASKAPYCPSSYSFAFNPPAGDGSGNGWW